MPVFPYFILGIFLWHNILLIFASDQADYVLIFFLTFVGLISCVKTIKIMDLIISTFFFLNSALA